MLVLRSRSLHMHYDSRIQVSESFCVDLEVRLPYKRTEATPEAICVIHDALLLISMVDLPIFL